MGEYKQSVWAIGNVVYINGEKLPPTPNKRRGSHVVQVGDRIFVNGYEWKDNQWKRTLRSFLSDWF